VKTYWTTIPNQQVYSTFDWGIRDEDGYFFILGRTDDVINVAGHRLGTREIEESLSSHPNVAEVAVVGVADQLKGQVAVAFAILKDPAKADTLEKKLAHEGEMMNVDTQLGAVARRRACTSSACAQNALGQARAGRSGAVQGRDPGDPTTIEDRAHWQIQAARLRRATDAPRARVSSRRPAVSSTLPCQTWSRRQPRCWSRWWVALVKRAAPTALAWLRKSLPRYARVVGVVRARSSPSSPRELGAQAIVSGWGQLGSPEWGGTVKTTRGSGCAGARLANRGHPRHRRPACAAVRRGR
jgi:hypothetical protein